MSIYVKHLCVTAPEVHPHLKRACSKNHQSAGALPNGKLRPIGLRDPPAPPDAKAPSRATLPGSMPLPSLLHYR
eukprot:798582-Pyramimonas_sp.AAC.1